MRKRVEELARDMAREAAEALGVEEASPQALELLEEDLRISLSRFVESLKPSKRGELSVLWDSLVERAAVPAKDLPRRFRQWVKQGFMTQEEYQAVLQLIRGEDPSLPPGVSPQDFFLKVSTLLLRFRSAKRR